MSTQPATFPLISYPKTQLLEAFLQAANRMGLPIALWQLPGESVQHLVVDLSGEANWRKADLEELPKGFVVAPFDNGQDQCYFLQADLHYSSDTDRLEESLETAAFGSEKSKKKQEFWEHASTFLKTGKGDEHPYFGGQLPALMPDQAPFEAMVEKAVAQMQAGAFQKVVLSRNKAISLPKSFHAVSHFLRLCETYPNAFISLVSLPQVGTWTGASPEILIEVKAQRYFRTVALAGTQPRDQFAKLSDATWRQKEIEEQALVSRYIINSFKKIRLREFEEIGPKTVQAGSLIHLRTDFMVDMEAVNFPQLGTVMLDLLHPTSAVCGMPKSESLAFIREHEHYNRECYAGFLGPVHIQNNTHLFVNLRCARLLHGQAVLYAGAGITADSEADREYKETEMKMEVMRRVLARE